jgi:hypothetical protein
MKVLLYEREPHDESIEYLLFVGVQKGKSNMLFVIVGSDRALHGNIHSSHVSFCVWCFIYI